MKGVIPMNIRERNYIIERLNSIRKGLQEMTIRVHEKNRALSKEIDFILSDVIMLMYRIEKFE